MKLAFTVCSNNYLAQAKSLGDSVRKTNPEYLFYIGLVDKLSNEIDYEKEIIYPIIISEQIGIPAFDYLWKKYSIIELSTCVRPFFIDYFINQYSDIEYLFYLDPDLYVFNNLNNIENEFVDDTNVLLTPHILTPIDLDGKIPNEQLFLNYGIYNSGFWGLKHPNQAKEFIDWFKERVYNFGYNRTNQGMFVDQLWFNLVPIFFNHVIFSKHPGLNMAPWNLHERILSECHNEYFVNNDFKLIFYHFSDYKYSNSSIISQHYTRYSFDTNPELKAMYEHYHNLLLSNGIQKFEMIKWHYMELKESYLESELQEKIRSSFPSFMKHIIKKMLPPKLINAIGALRK